MSATLEMQQVVAAPRQVWQRKKRINLGEDKNHSWFCPRSDVPIHVGEGIYSLCMDFSCQYSLFDVVIASARSFGENRDREYQSICALAYEQGLYKCPLPLAWAFRREYGDQPPFESIVIASEPIPSQLNRPCLLCVSHVRRGLLIDIAPGYPGLLWEPDDLFAFCRPVIPE